MTEANAAAALPPGAVLGGFRLVEQLGVDGLGELYRAQNIHALKVQRAVRVIRRELAAQPVFRTQLRQTVETLDCLEHPNLQRLYHIGEERDALYMVQELLLGRTLRTLTEEEPVRRTVATVADWVYQALCGLGHAHRNGIVHQELCPRREAALFFPDRGNPVGSSLETARLVPSSAIANQRPSHAGSGDSYASSSAGR